MDSLNIDMDIISIIVTVILNYVIFKLGEHYAYFKIARGIQNLKDHADALGTDRVDGTMEVEKIGEQYYAYIDNNFVGQGANLEEVKNILQKIVAKNPGRYSSMRIKMRE